MDSITTMCFSSWEDMLLLLAQTAMRMEFTKARRVIVSDVIARIMIPLKIQITGKPDFPPIVIRVTEQQIQRGKARTSITIVYFHFPADIQLPLVHRVTRVVYIKERRANVMDVTGRIMMQHEIRTIGNPDFQRTAIAVIDFRIQIGIARI
jgi:hypothetical protein